MPIVLKNTREKAVCYESGRALEALGHAIEYLVDQNQCERQALRYDEDHVEAIKILHETRMSIYRGCPFVENVNERIENEFYRLSTLINDKSIYRIAKKILSQVMAHLNCVSSRHS